MHASLRRHACLYTRPYTCLYTYPHAYPHACLHACLHTCLYTCMTKKRDHVCLAWSAHMSAHMSRHMSAQMSARMPRHASRLTYGTCLLYTHRDDHMDDHIPWCGRRNRRLLNTKKATGAKTEMVQEYETRLIHPSMQH